MNTSQAKLLTTAIVASCAMALLGVNSVCAEEPLASATTLCEVTASPLPLNSEVTFTAVASTDLHHGITLSDADCPNAGVRLGHASDSADPRVEQFLTRLSSAAPPNKWRDFTGTFTGRLELNPAGKPRFTLSAVDDFRELPTGI